MKSIQVVDVKAEIITLIPAYASECTTKELLWGLITHIEEYGGTLRFSWIEK